MGPFVTLLMALKEAFLRGSISPRVPPILTPNYEGAMRGFGFELRDDPQRLNHPIVLISSPPSSSLAPTGTPRLPYYTTYAILYYTALFYTTYAIPYTALDYTILHYTVLHFSTLCYTTLHYTILHYTTLHNTTLY